MYNVFNYIPPYLLFTGLSFLFSCIVLMICMFKDNLINNHLPKYVIIILGAVYGGAILFSVVSLVIDDVVNNGALNAIKIMFSGKYGLVYYGGLAGIVITTFVFVNKKLISYKIYNILAFVIPLFHSISRLGCYFAGCCYGVQSNILYELPHFSNGEFSGDYCVPVQIYESIFEFLLAIIIFIIYIRNTSKYNLLKVYLIFYSIFRILVEFLRGDIKRGVYFGVSFSQYISILIIIFLLFQKNIKNYRRSQYEYN